jgi:hypothetical protein
VDYARHYQILMDRAETRVLVGYSEMHHVVPQCVDETGQYAFYTVRLTPEEHFVAHQLLVKMHPGNHKLVYAALCMTWGTKDQKRTGNKLFGWLRRRLALPFSDTHRAKISAAKIKFYADPANCRMTGESQHWTLEMRERLSTSLRAYYQANPMSATHREKISKALTGYVQTDEQRAKNSAAVTEWWKKRKAAKAAEEAATHAG